MGEILLDIDEQLAKYDAVPGRMNAILKKLGIPAPRRPKMRDMPRLEGRISDMTDADLGDKQGEFAVWEAYLEPLIGDADAQTDACKARRDYLMSELKKNATGAQAGRADKARTDSRFVDADAELLAARGVARVIRATFSGQETQRKVCSRYVEVRKMEHEALTRTHNVQKQRHGAPKFRRTPSKD